MAEVNTSSYPKPRPSKGIQEQISGWNQIEQQEINVDRSKLELAIKNQENLYNSINALPPDAGPEEIKKWGQNAVKMKLVNPRTFAETMTNLPAMSGDPVKDREAIQRFRSTLENRMNGNLEAMKWKYGEMGTRDSGQSLTPTRRDLRSGAVSPTGQPIAKQVDVSTPVFNPNTQQMEPYGQRGDQIPQGAQPVPGAAPGSYYDPQTTNRLNQSVDVPLPTARPPVKPTDKVWGDREAEEAGIYEKPNTFNERFGATSKPAFGPPAMFEEGKKMLTDAQQNASRRAMAIKPVIQALPLMNTPGFLSGPLSEQFTNAVATLKTFGLIDTAAENDPTAIRQEVTKKLAQYISGSPISNRSDAAQALSEAASPNPNKNILPALIKLSKDAVALERVEIAKANSFKDKDLSQVGSYFAKFPQSIDERAFSLDLETEEKSKKLVDDMAKKLEKGSKREKADAEKFFKSLRIATEQGFYQ